MRRHEMPAGRMSEYQPRHPERTAYRHVLAPFSSDRWGNVEFQEWPNRASMLKTIDLQERAGAHAWKMCQP